MKLFDLRTIRISKGLTQRNVQDLTNIAFSNICKMERGNRKVSPLKALTLADVYNISDTDLDEFLVQTVNSTNAELDIEEAKVIIAYRKNKS